MPPLDFEKPVVELEAKIAELRQVAGGGALNIAEEVERMQAKADRILASIYGALTPAQKVAVARHEARPRFCDYARELIQDFTPLAGDRLYAEDAALTGGLGRFGGRPIVVMGHERGRDTESRLKHNFGMARPEGYRKAQRLVHLASRFALPVVTFVDTAGAYPGVGAEERGQAEAIARSMQVFLGAPVPIVSVVIGEGGSGGAIAIACADRVYMLEHAVYSVISPEGCASILWRDAKHAAEAAQALKMTAQDLLRLGLIDGVIPEPVGGAHRRRSEAIAAVGRQVARALDALTPWDADAIVGRRREIFLNRGSGA
jgi:acetyl-CoA carboxylase carboxyl transferase subunit alpha